MKPKSLKLSIKKPCSEKWSAMTEVNFDTRFCASCERNIIDFTNKTDEEIIAFFQKNDKKICARFHSTQLDKKIEIPKKHTSKLTKTAAVVFAGLLGTTAIHAQSNNTLTTEISIPQDSVLVKGQVLDFSNKKGISVYVLVDSHKDWIKLKEDGRFEFWCKPTDFIRFSGGGYDLLRISYNELKELKGLIELKRNSHHVLEGYKSPPFPIIMGDPSEDWKY